MIARVKQSFTGYGQIWASGKVEPGETEEITIQAYY